MGKKRTTFAVRHTCCRAVSLRYSRMVPRSCAWLVVSTDLHVARAKVGGTGKEGTRGLGVAWVPPLLRCECRGLSDVF